MAKPGHPPHPLTEKVRKTWSELYIQFGEGDRRPNARQTKDEVDRLYRKDYDWKPKGITENTVRKIINAMRVGPEDESHRLDWEPWKDDSETPEETCYLLKLRAVVNLRSGNFDNSVIDWPISSPLSKSEASWAKRIRPLVSDLDLMVQYLIASEYAIRWRISEISGDPPNTQALDNLIAIQPWKKENTEVWSKGVAGGLISTDGSDFHFGSKSRINQQLRTYIDHQLQGDVIEPDLKPLTWQSEVLRIMEARKKPDENEREPVTFLGKPMFNPEPLLSGKFLDYLTRNIPQLPLTGK